MSERLYFKRRYLLESGQVAQVSNVVQVESGDITANMSSCTQTLSCLAFSHQLASQMIRLGAAAMAGGYAVSTSLSTENGGHGK